MSFTKEELAKLKNDVLAMEESPIKQLEDSSLKLDNVNECLRKLYWAIERFNSHVKRTDEAILEVISREERR